MSSPRRAFEELFHATYDSVVRYGMRRLPGRAEAEDVASEVFTAAWRSWERGERVELPWLYRVARNKIADHYRQDARRQQLHTDEAQRLSDVVPLPQLEHLALWIALGKLGERERDALTLTYWEGLTGGEVAQALGCTTTTVWALLTRGRRRLRRLLEHDNLPTMSDERGAGVEVLGI